MPPLALLCLEAVAANFHLCPDLEGVTGRYVDARCRDHAWP